ncbi:MAG TPA: hypothetical protein VMA77_15350 [Solirubrobacteraceae bacterium]|nr:hypothetical protein [Solirubrobacteraceae bacterium]
MTIEVVSEPADLSTWDPGSDPFYLEVFGETRPVVDTAFAELIPASAGPDATPVRGASAPVYEYWWTIGHPGLPRQEGGFLNWLHAPSNGHDVDTAAAEATQFWTQLGDPAALVYMFFPRNGGWRIKELVATVKYLDPVPDQRDFWAKAMQDWSALQPLVQDASTLAGALGPQVGIPVKGTVTTLNALAQLKLTSIPQGAGFDWSVGKVTFGHQDDAHPERAGVMQGVVWRLPAKMFTELGGRLTGSLAVSFIPCGLQQEGGPSAQDAKFEPRALLAHAVVYSKDGTAHWLPSDRGFVRLELAPQPPPTAARSKPPDGPAATPSA